MLAAKSPWRKNIKNGCITRRPCLCDGERALAQAVRPAHRIWMMLVEGRSPHGYTFPSLTASKFNKPLQRVRVEAGCSNGSRYSTRLFRRGATQELLEKGSSDIAIRPAGCWGGMDFRSYIDAQLTDSMEISCLVATVSDSECDDEANATERLTADYQLRKKTAQVPWIRNIHVIERPIRILTFC